VCAVQALLLRSTPEEPLALPPPTQQVSVFCTFFFCPSKASNLVLFAGGRAA
jgi:hypothetical protein